MIWSKNQDSRNLWTFVGITSASCFHRSQWTKSPRPLQSWMIVSSSISGARHQQDGPTELQVDGRNPAPPWDVKRPCESWDIYHIFTISTGTGFPSTVWPHFCWWGPKLAILRCNLATFVCNLEFGFQKFFLKFLNEPNRNATVFLNRGFFMYIQNENQNFRDLPPLIKAIGWKFPLLKPFKNSQIFCRREKKSRPWSLLGWRSMELWCYGGGAHGM